MGNTESRWIRWPFYYLCASFVVLHGCVVGPYLAITTPVTFAASTPFSAWIFWTWLLFICGKIHRYLTGHPWMTLRRSAAISFGLVFAVVVVHELFIRK